MNLDYRAAPNTPPPPVCATSSSPLLALTDMTSTRKRARTAAADDAEHAKSSTSGADEQLIHDGLDSQGAQRPLQKQDDGDNNDQAIDCNDMRSQQDEEESSRQVVRVCNDTDEQQDDSAQPTVRAESVHPSGAASIENTVSYESRNCRAHTPATLVTAAVSSLATEVEAACDVNPKQHVSSHDIIGNDSSNRIVRTNNDNNSIVSDNNTLTPTAAATSCSNLPSLKHTHSSASVSSHRHHSTTDDNNNMFDALGARICSPRASFSAHTPMQHGCARSRDTDVDVDAECDDNDEENEEVVGEGKQHSASLLLPEELAESDEAMTPRKPHSTAALSSTTATMTTNTVTPPPAQSLLMRLRSCGENNRSHLRSVGENNNQSCSCRTASDVTEHTNQVSFDNKGENNPYTAQTQYVDCSRNSHATHNHSSADMNSVTADCCAAEQMSRFSHGAGTCTHSSSSSSSNNDSHTNNNSVNSANSNNNSNGCANRLSSSEFTRRYTQPTLAAYGLVGDSALLRKALLDREGQIDELGTRVGVLEAELHRRESQLAIFESQREELQCKLDRFRNAMRTEMLLSARQARTDARRVLHQKHFELGQIAILPHNGREVWVEGNVFRELLLRLQELHCRREEVEQLKKSAHMTVKQLQRIDKEREDSSNAMATTASSSAEGADALYEAHEELQLRTAEYSALTNMIANIKERQAALEQEKKAFLKEIRRLSDEDASEYLAVPTIGEDERYVLMNLLGKGGFSEVWRAFDLHEGRYVACKIHRVNRDWPAPTRAHYMRHAERELAIMRGLHHAHLTKLYDVFRLGESAFVSVMEFSPGVDLDTYLKRYHVLRECDARLILLQVVSALRHLVTLEEPIIHYDLKPANILLHSTDPSVLDIKITDFGLSKIVQASSADGPSDNPTIELTSQGTGTYWYLPPECFDTSATPRINSKVDIWSVGVIFYQMVYGRRPFAEGESQRRIWQEKLIISSAKALRFPESPRVSEEAKEVMRGCLAASVAERWDVHQLSQHPYLMRTSRRSVRTRSANVGGANATSSATLAGVSAGTTNVNNIHMNHVNSGRTVSPTTAHVARLGVTLSDSAAPASPNRGIVSHSF